MGAPAFALPTLEALSDGPHDVVAAYTQPDRGAGRGRRVTESPVKRRALELGIETRTPTSLKDSEAVAALAALRPDAAAVVAYGRFLPGAVLDLFPKGALNLHPSLLPRHRGPSSINWPIIFGETKTGLSIFWPDNGLDTGPILLQKEVEIGPDDTLGSVYFNHLFPLGVDATIEAVDLVRADNAPRTPQWELAGADAGTDPSELGTYEGWCRAEQVRIDWQESVAKVYNLIRGSNPQPGAWTTHRGKQLQIFDSRLAETGASPGAGAVSSVTDDGFCVWAGDGQIEVLRVRPAGEAKMAASEFAATVGLAVGDRFD